MALKMSLSSRVCPRSLRLMFRADALALPQLICAHGGVIWRATMVTNHPLAWRRRHGDGKAVGHGGTAD